MNSEVRKFKQEFNCLSHDDQFVLLQKQDTKLLINVLLEVTSAHDFYLEEQMKRSDNGYLKLIIDTTYTRAMITTILRARGAYGKLKGGNK